MIVSCGRSSLGASLYMPDDALVQRLRARLPDEFSQNLLQGALDALTQQNVNTRVQHFSVSLRELSNHVLTAIRSSRPDWVAGAPGFEPGNGGIKIRCLTAWLRPSFTELICANLKYYQWIT